MVDSESNRHRRPGQIQSRRSAHGQSRNERSPRGDQGERCLPHRLRFDVVGQALHHGARRRGRCPPVRRQRRSCAARRSGSAPTGLFPVATAFSAVAARKTSANKNQPVPPERFEYRGQPIGTSFHLGTMASHAVVPGPAVVGLMWTSLFLQPVNPWLRCDDRVRSVVNAAKVEKGSSVVVLGAGGED